MGGVSDNAEKTDTFVTTSDAQCTPIGAVPLITEILKKLTPSASLVHSGQLGGHDRKFYFPKFK